jgi:4-amino-4-deoxy-L-arabinose transferase-like glycosyltransferase
VPEARSLRGDALMLATIASADFALHVALSGRYGYWIDELYFIACGDHLDWGYVDHPPLIAAVAALSRSLFGDSLFAIRVFPALAGAALVFLAGWIARQLGGGRTAQVIAALATAAAPVFAGFATVLTMNSFEPLFWMGCASLAIALSHASADAGNRGAAALDDRAGRLHSRPGLWVAVGALIGIGLLNKHSMAFFTLALIGGLLLSPQRRVLFDRWALLAGAVAAAIVLPHVLWQIAHGWPTRELLANARRYQHQPVTPLQFLWGQIQIVQPLAFPLWAAGLYFLLVDRRAAAVRFLGWAFLLQFLAFMWMQAKTYYLAPAYPMLFAAGAVLVEGLARTRRWVAWTVIALLILGGLSTAPYVLPILPVAALPTYLRLLGIQEVRPETRAMGNVPQIFADMLGWDELVDAVARVYRGLTPDEQQQVALWGRDYGVAGAIDYFGGRYGLPKAISGVQNYYLWGPGDRSGAVMLAIGFRESDLRPWFDSVEQAAEVTCEYCMPDRQLQRIFICRGLKRPLAEFWPLVKCWTCARAPFQAIARGDREP